MKNDRKDFIWRGAPRNSKVLATRSVIAVFAFILTSAISLRLVPVRADSARTLWRQVPAAQVKLDDKTPLTWSIYQPVKDKGEKWKDPNLVLILLGHRYLFLDLKAKRAYEVEVSDLQKSGQDVESGDLAVESRLIPTSDWTSHNVGPVQLYQVKLGDYDRVLQVSIPHPFNPFVP
jgi:hypothetical protein